MIFGSQLTDGCGLTDSVYTDHKYNRLLLFKVIGILIHGHLVTEIVHNKILGHLGTLQVLFLHLLFQFLDHAFRGLVPHIGLDQCFFEFIIELVGDLRCFKYICDTGTGLLQPFL